MANNYLQFSEQIEKLTGEEQVWLETRLAELEQEMEDTCECLGFQYEICTDGGTGTGLWLYEYEFGDFFHLEKLVQEFLTKFRPKHVFTLSYAVTCSKMCIGAFGGGAMVVTATDVDYMEVGEWASMRAREILSKTIMQVGPDKGTKGE